MILMMSQSTLASRNFMQKQIDIMSKVVIVAASIYVLKIACDAIIWAVRMGY